MRSSRRSPALLLLLALFLTAQMLAIAHESGHRLAGDNEHCNICLRADQYRAAAPAAELPATVVAPSVEPGQVAQPIYPDPRAAAPRARGPPRTPFAL